MEFEFDPGKSRANERKHGIGFLGIQAIWEDTQAVVVPARSTTEPRYAIIGKVEGRLWTCIFTVRGERIRIISARRSRHEEQEGYANG